MSRRFLTNRLIQNMSTELFQKIEIFRKIVKCTINHVNLSKWGPIFHQKYEKGCIWIHLCTYGHTWIHKMDTYGGPRARLWHKTGGGALGPWTGPGPGPMDRARAQGTLDRARAHGTLAHPPHPRAPPPVLCHSLALGPPYVSIICIHVCPYVHRCIHMYAYVCFWWKIGPHFERFTWFIVDFMIFLKKSCFWKSFVEIFWIRGFVGNVRGMLLAWFSIDFIYVLN